MGSSESKPGEPNSSSDEVIVPPDSPRNSNNKNVRYSDIEKKDVNAKLFYPPIARVKVRGKTHGVIIEENSSTRFGTDVQSGSNYMFIPHSANDSTGIKASGNHVSCGKNHPDHGKYVYYVS